jgi:pimeloyl-ACP methyl ester carboxylesterase
MILEKLLSISILFFAMPVLCDDEGSITPYKFTDSNELPTYSVPQSSRFTAPRSHPQEPAIVYYLSKPKAEEYPIALLCTGSSSESSISSVIHFHRYFLQEFMDMGVGVITVEQWGVDGDSINPQEFMEHYTRSQRFNDHIQVVETLIAHPPKGWNGQFIFLGVSEGGPLVLSLTARYQHCCRATINWCGAGAWSWREELWAFIEAIQKNAPVLEGELCIARSEFDELMDATLVNPTTNRKFMGMTYTYHADALTYPHVEYRALRTPLLVVAGAQDSIIQSCDEFIAQAQSAGATTTYIRVDDMDHYIRQRPDIIKQSFEWLQKILET